MHQAKFLKSYISKAPFQLETDYVLLKFLQTFFQKDKLFLDLKELKFSLQNNSICFIMAFKQQPQNNNQVISFLQTFPSKIISSQVLRHSVIHRVMPSTITLQFINQKRYKWYNCFNNLVQKSKILKEQLRRALNREQMVQIIQMSSKTNSISLYLVVRNTMQFCSVCTVKISATSLHLKGRIRKKQNQGVVLNLQQFIQVSKYLSRRKLKFGSIFIKDQTLNFYQQVNYSFNSVEQLVKLTTILVKSFKFFIFVEGCQILIRLGILNYQQIIPLNKIFKVNQKCKYYASKSQLVQEVRMLMQQKMSRQVQEKEKKVRELCLVEQDFCRMVPIAQGGFSQIYTVDHKGQRKVLKRAKSKQYQEKIQNQKRLLEHIPNSLYICKAETYSFQGQLALLFQECDFSFYQFTKSKLKMLSLQFKIDMAVQITEAINLLHQHGIIHLDIKPQNFLVKFLNQFPQIKICDFGQSLLTNQINQMKRVVGISIPYTSPQLLRRQQPNHFSDIFSLGAVLHQLFFGFSHIKHRQNTSLQELKAGSFALNFEKINGRVQCYSCVVKSVALVVSRCLDSECRPDSFQILRALKRIRQQIDLLQ